MCLKLTIGIGYWLLCFVAVNDTLDDILGESGDEEESDQIVNQVLDEIGIEISGKVCYNGMGNLRQLLQIYKLLLYLY